MSKETELNEDQIIAAAGQWAATVLGMEHLVRVARQVIAADRAQRQSADTELAKLHENGAKAWADVPDATAWVDALRGNAPSPAAVERKPMTAREIEDMATAISIYSGDYGAVIARAVEAHHGITAQQGGEP